jgi:hypothetical protein
MKVINATIIGFILVFLLLPMIAFCNPEFLVNTDTTGVQTNASTGMDGSGNFIVTWESDAADGDGLGILAKRFDTQGKPIGDEFQVNIFTTGNQNNSAVAMSKGGKFIIVWESVAQDGEGRGVFAQLYDLDGNVVKSEFQVNVTTASEQREPAVAIDPNGNFVVAWSSNNQDGNNYGVFAKVYDNNGNILKDEFQVNNFTTGAQRYPAVAMDQEGNFVVTWSSNAQDGDSYGVYAKKFDLNGNMLIDEFLVNNFTTGNQRYSTIACEMHGNFLITWSSAEQDGNLGGIFAKQYDPNGNVLKDEFQVNTYSVGDQNFPCVAIDGDSHYAISWGSNGQDGSNMGIFAIGFDSDWQILGREFQVNTYSKGNQSSPSIATYHSGLYVIAYTSENQAAADSSSDIYARQFDIYHTPPADIIPPGVTIISPTDGEIVYGSIDVAVQANDESGIKGVEVQFNGGDWLPCTESNGLYTYRFDLTNFQALTLEIQARATDNSENANIGYSAIVSPQVVNGSDIKEFRVNMVKSGNQTNPIIARDFAGNTVIAWQGPSTSGPGSSVFARKYDTNGDPISDEFQINTTSTAANPAISMDRNGNYIIAWERSNTIVARKFSIDGSILANEVVLSATGTDPAIDMNSTGDFVASWTVGTGQSTSGIVARKFMTDSTPLSDELIVFPEADTYESSVGINEDGNFTVIGTISNADDTNSEIVGQKYDSNGGLFGLSFRINTYTDSWQYLSALTMNSKGDFDVVWQSMNQDDSGMGIYAQRILSNGSPYGGEFRVNTVNWENQVSPALSMDDMGNFVVVWDDYYMGGEKRNVFTKVYNNFGQTLDEFKVNSDVLATNQPTLPKVAMNANGDFMIVWQDLSDIYARAFNFAEYDSSPPKVQIPRPLNGSWVSGQVPIQIEAVDESDVKSVEISINHGDWLQCLKTDIVWNYNLDTSEFFDNSSIVITARATDRSPNENVGYSQPTTLIVKKPQVHIYTEGSLDKPGDTLSFKVNAMNTKFDDIDLYIACNFGNSFFFYPDWGISSAIPIRIERGVFDEYILSIPYIFKPSGTFIFYAAITDAASLDIISIDSKQINFQ